MINTVNRCSIYGRLSFNHLLICCLWRRSWFCRRFPSRSFCWMACWERALSWGCAATWPQETCGYCCMYRDKTIGFCWSSVVAVPANGNKIHWGRWRKLWGLCINADNSYGRFSKLNTHLFAIFSSKSGRNGLPFSNNFSTFTSTRQNHVLLGHCNINSKNNSAKEL